MTKTSLDQTTTVKITGLVKGITNQVCYLRAKKYISQNAINFLTAVISGLSPTAVTSKFVVQARSVVRDLDPINELAFLRLRSNKTEFLIAPGYI